MATKNFGRLKFEGFYDRTMRLVEHGVMKKPYYYEAMKKYPPVRPFPNYDRPTITFAEDKYIDMFYTRSSWGKLPNIKFGTNPDRPFDNPAVKFVNRQLELIEQGYKPHIAFNLVEEEWEKLTRDIGATANELLRLRTVEKNTELTQLVESVKEKTCLSEATLFSRALSDTKLFENVIFARRDYRKEKYKNIRSSPAGPVSSTRRIASVPSVRGTGANAAGERAAGEGKLMDFLERRKQERSAKESGIGALGSFLKQKKEERDVASKEGGEKVEAKEETKEEVKGEVKEEKKTE